MRRSPTAYGVPLSDRESDPQLLERRRQLIIQAAETLDDHKVYNTLGFMLGLLAIPSIFIRYFSRDLLIGLRTNFWGGSLFCLPSNLSLIDAEFMSIFSKILPLCFIHLEPYTIFTL